MDEFSPERILKAFSKAEILVSMSMMGNRRAYEPDERLWEVKTTGETGDTFTTMIDHHLGEIVKHATEVGDNIILEWAIWPMIAFDQEGVLQAYSRFSIRPIPTIQ